MADPLAGLDPRLAGPLRSLLAASGGRVTVNSGYRSSARQAQLYQQAVAKYGSEAAARHWVAPPGHSNHNLGMAVDLGGDVGWAQQHAAEHGLHNPMPYEPWHFEPIGTGAAAMAGKTRSGKVGPSVTPQPQLMQQAATPTPSAGGDPYAFFSSLAAQQQAAPRPPLYDPFAPTTQQVPGTPDPYGIGGLGRPQTVSGPSDWQAYSQAQQNATTAQGNPNSDAAAKLKAEGDLHIALAKALEANPTPQYQQEPYQQFPDQPQAAIPTRPAPRYDTLSGLLATLGGFVDPQHAGQYGQAPLQAGLGQADQAYQDSLQHYAMLAQQMQQHYEHELAKRNDLAHYLHEQAGANFQNAQASTADKRGIASEGAQGAYGNTLAGSLLASGADQLRANQATTAANLLGKQIDYKSAQSAANVAAFNAADKITIAQQKTLMDVMQKVYGSDNRLQGVQDAAAQRFQSAQQHNEMMRTLQGMKASSAESLLGERLGALERMSTARNNNARDLLRLKLGIDAQHPEGIRGLSQLDRINLQHLGSMAQSLTNRASVEYDQLSRAYPLASDQNGQTAQDWITSHGSGVADQARAAVAAYAAEATRLRTVHGGTAQVPPATVGLSGGPGVPTATAPPARRPTGRTYPDISNVRIGR